MALWAVIPRTLVGRYWH